MRAARHTNELPIPLHHHGHAVAAQRQPAQKGVHPLQGQVRCRHTLEGAVGGIDAPGACGHQLLGAEIDVNRRPDGGLGLVSAFKPRAAARLEHHRFDHRALQRPLNAHEAVQRARPIALGAQTQFGFLIAVAPQTDETALAIAVVGVVVGVAVDGGGQPQPRAQRCQIAGADGQRGRGRHATREGGFQHRFRAGDVPIHRLGDAVDGLHQQLPGQIVHRPAPSLERQAAQHRRQHQHQQDIRPRQQLAQGQAIDQRHGSVNQTREDHRPAAALRAAALSVRSQLNSGSSRPKWP